MEPYLAGVEQLRVQHVERKVGFDDALLFHVFDLLHSPGHVAHEVVDDLSDHGSHHFSKSVVTEQFHEFAGQWKTRFSTGQNWIDSFSWITWRPAHTERNAIIYRAMASLSYLATMGSATKCDILNRNGEKTSEWLNELIKKKSFWKSKSTRVEVNGCESMLWRPQSRSCFPPTRPDLASKLYLSSRWKHISTIQGKLLWFNASLAAEIPTTLGECHDPDVGGARLEVLELFSISGKFRRSDETTRLAGH